MQILKNTNAKILKNENVMPRPQVYEFSEMHKLIVDHKSLFNREISDDINPVMFQKPKINVLVIFKY